MFCIWFSFYYKNIKHHDFLLWISRWVRAQLFQSWNLKQSLAIFQTGWSLLGVAWAVKRKFWLKKRSLFPSNFTVPPVTTSRVVWPWVACSVKEGIDSCTISPFGLLQKQMNSLNFRYKKNIWTFLPLTVNRLTIDCVNLEFTWWQCLKKFSQSVLSRDRIPIPHQRGLVQVESGQVLRQGRHYGVRTIHISRLGRFWEPDLLTFKYVGHTKIINTNL